MTDPAPTTDPAPQTDPAPAPNSDPNPAPEDEITAPVGDVPFDKLPAATQTEVRRLRTADRAARAERATATATAAAYEEITKNGGMTPEARKALGKLLGYEQDTPSADELTGKVGEATTRADAAESRATAAERANMILRTAPDAGGNADLLLDSNGFLTAVKDINPTDRAAISTAIKQWVTDHPSFAKQDTRTTASGSGSGRPAGASSTSTTNGLEAAVARTMGR